ncbi:type ISP restriction/modification enzyme [Streptacidiphilus sp. PB12-B1b]|uniref:type ISP restriction/modification enzyme n=1 Tax=Streptacidiphilus sp. PB12-B1b TaxID=2705012 RepID=UPI001CDC96AD|nr:type ISP restriction/modification enzyme [Streptacidiphilus sp. PB12-B1b]
MAGRCQGADAPLLAELMPWSVPGLRLGRGWVRSAHPEVLAARWQRLADAAPDARAALFGASRARTLDSAVGQLPGQSGSTGTLARDPGPCPPPVRIRHGAFDRLWLLPDQRVLDAARPELWRVADEAQLFACVQPHAPGPAVAFSAELPDGHRERGLGRIHPLYRRPGGREPNLAPGLTEYLGAVLGTGVTAEALLAWIAAAGRPADGAPGARTGEEVPIPLPASAGTWAEGVALGRRILWLHTFGLRGAPEAGSPHAGSPDAGGGRPRMPGGRRPFVRERVQGLPDAIGHDADTESLLLGSGRIAPVPRSVWEFQAAGQPVLAGWFARRTADPGARPGSLEALGLSAWPQQSTADLVELATVLALLAELRPAQAALLRPERGPWISAADLASAAVLPAPAWTRRPASVLSHQEEGPGGQFALL